MNNIRKSSEIVNEKLSQAPEKNLIPDDFDDSALLSDDTNCDVEDDANGAANCSANNTTNAEEGEKTTPPKKSLAPAPSVLWKSIINSLGRAWSISELSGAILLDGKQLDDNVFSSVIVQVRDKLAELKMRYSRETMLDYVRAIANETICHPVLNYFGNLPEWDGVDRIRQLADCLPCVGGKDPYRWLEVWLSGAVRRAYTGRHNYTLIIQGPQGCGKSYFSGWLGRSFPGAFHSGHIEATKDCLIRSAEVFIWEIGEFHNAFKRATEGEIKDFLSKEAFRARPPYGTTDRDMKSLANYIGTTNKFVFTDDTGSRRYLVLNLTDIKREYIKIDREQLWAQAAARCDEDKWQLSQEEARQKAEENEEHTVHDSIEDFISLVLRPGADDDFVPNYRITSYLMAKGFKVSTGEQRIIAKVVRDLGGRRASRREGKIMVRGFLGVCIADEQSKRTDGGPAS